MSLFSLKFEIKNELKKEKANFSSNTYENSPFSRKFYVYFIIFHLKVETVITISFIGLWKHIFFMYFFKIYVLDLPLLPKYFILSFFGSKILSFKLYYRIIIYVWKMSTLNRHDFLVHFMYCFQDLYALDLPILQKTSHFRNAWECVKNKNTKK